MSKKRKTKRQKLLSEIRFKLNTLETKKSSLEQSTLPQKDKYTFNAPVVHAQSKMSSKDYGYVSKEVRQTLSITGIIIMINILTFILLEKQILNLNFLGF